MTRKSDLPASVLVVMGVAGSGKSTVGGLLAAELGCQFLDGDSLHPRHNIEKMSRGVSLTDFDRAPWLAAIRERILQSCERGECLVVACSALKQQYRDFLSAGIPIQWVYLKGTEELIRSRLLNRREHYMKVNLLASQFADLEEPSKAIVADISLPPGEIVRNVMQVLKWLRSS